jgi:hypothetical protein
MSETAAERNHLLNKYRTVGGLFGPRYENEGFSLRPLSTAPNPLTMADFDEDFEEVSRFDIDGIEVVVTTADISDEGSALREFNFRVHGDPIVGEFYSDKKLSPAAITKMATAAYNEARIANLKSRLGLVPSLDAALNTEMTRIGRAQTNLHAPAGWNGEYDLTPVKDYVGGHIKADDIYARADYAVANEEGVAYGFNMNSSLIGDILVGDMLDGELGSDYSDRVYDAMTSTTWVTAEKFFRDEYGSELLTDGDYGDVAVEFFVKYGPGGIKRASTQEMGERAESETKLLALSNSWIAGGSVQSDLAAKLGYRYERQDTPDGSFAGHYVKVEEAIV